MSERREFNASSIEEALEKAASALDVGREDLSYETLDSGSSGFLGLGARDARITVELPVDRDDTAQEDVAVPNEPSEEPEDTDQREDYSDSGASESEAGDSYTEVSEASDEIEALSDQLMESVRAHVETVLDAMTFEGEVSIRDGGEVVVAEINSEDAGLLIGQKGETIDALQYLVNAAFHRERQFPKRVLLDCEGYRERRLKAVQGMAHRTAKRVSRERKAIDLPHMSPSERRAVHSYLKDNPKVTTASAGNDETRRVTIFPA